MRTRSPCSWVTVRRWCDGVRICVSSSRACGNRFPDILTSADHVRECSRLIDLPSWPYMEGAEMEHMQSDPGRTEQLPEGFQLVRELARDRSRAVYLAMDLVRGGQVTLTALGRLADPGGLDNLVH